MDLSRTLRPVNQTASNGMNRAFCPSGDELLPITRPTPLRDIDHDDSELREQFERAGSRFAEETIPSEQTPEASVHRRLHQIAVRECLPAAIPRSVAVNSETGQDGCEMHVHVGIKQPHERSRRARMLPSRLRVKPQMERRSRRSHRSLRETYRRPGIRGLKRQPAGYRERLVFRPGVGDRLRSTDNPCRLLVASLASRSHLHSTQLWACSPRWWRRPPWRFRA